MSEKRNNYLPTVSDFYRHRQEEAATYQVGGDHYTRLSIQPWDAMRAWMTPEEFRGYLRGNVVKYLARDKGATVEDLRKARHYLDRLIEEAEGNLPESPAG